jgi:arylformamidase
LKTSVLRVTLGRGAKTVITVGASELPELVLVFNCICNACEAIGEEIALIHVPGRNHFSVFDDLANPNRWQMTALKAMW